MKQNSISKQGYTTLQTVGLTILRVMIGWHFLYEGLIKLSTPGWSGKSYLEASVGPFSSMFKALAASDSLLQVADILNVWGLILIGLGLFLGICTRISAFSGLFLLAFYYLSYPPFADFAVTGYVDGNYWIVNRNLIEMGALFVLMIFPSGHMTGLDRFFCRSRKDPYIDTP